MEDRTTSVSKDESVLSAWQEQIAEAAMSPRLHSRIARQSDKLFRQFAEHYNKLKAMPRRVRRATQKKWKKTLAGVALMLALGSGSAMAATINVPCTGDPVADGTALIAAINTANIDAAADTIVLGNSCIHTLTAGPYDLAGATGLPVITTEITIDGNDSTIERSSAVETPEFRIIAIDMTGNLTLDETRISGGRGTSFSEGGGVFNDGTLAMINSTISGNSTSGDGGGMYNNDGTLAITNSTISGNSAARGGGVYDREGAMTITNSTISGNSTSGRGGGMYIYDESVVTIINSTISDNSTSGYSSKGGGVFTTSDALHIINSTITGNSTSGNNSAGGGVYNFSGDLNIINSIISGNTAVNSLGDEVYNADTTLPNSYTIFSHDGLTTADALYGVVLGPGSIDASSDEGNIPLTSILDTALANNGGPTFTHALVAGSPAIDAVGKDCPDTDQRLFGRPAGAACDMGAYEFGAVPPQVCGNGDIEGDEQCDDGNTTDNDGCTADCEVECVDSSEDCTADPQCQTAACVSTAGGGAICSISNKPNGSSCNDSSVCTQTDTCNGSGACVGSNPLNCADTNNCTVDACNPLTGCTHEPLKCNGLIANVCGTPGNDAILVLIFPAVVNGAGGNDNISAGLAILGLILGGATICGGDGNDILIGSLGPDKIFGDNGNDQIDGSWGNDAINGGDGTDKCIGGAGTDSGTACEPFVQ